MVPATFGPEEVSEDEPWSSVFSSSSFFAPSTGGGVSLFLFFFLGIVEVDQGPTEFLTVQTLSRVRTVERYTRQNVFQEVSEFQTFSLLSSLIISGPIWNRNRVKSRMNESNRNTRAVKIQNYGWAINNRHFRLNLIKLSLWNAEKFELRFKEYGILVIPDSSKKVILIRSRSTQNNKIV